MTYFYCMKTDEIKALLDEAKRAKAKLEVLINSGDCQKLDEAIKEAEKVRVKIGLATPIFITYLYK